MSRREGGRRSGRGAQRQAGGLQQLPWQQVRNPYKPVEVLSEDQVEAIHQAALRILEELGIEFMSDRALDRLAAGGAEVERASGLVRFDRGLVEQSLATVPERFTMTPRNDAKALEIGGDAAIFGLVNGPPFVTDLDRGRRDGNFADYLNLLRLGQSLNIVQYVTHQAVAPMDLPADTRFLDCYEAILTLTDKAFYGTAVGAERVVDALEMVAIARGERREDLLDRPSIFSVINVNSPRRIDGPLSEGLIALAEHGQPAVVTPFCLMGAMTPVTLAAALAQQHAEALAGIVLTQLARPGAPVVYGGFTSNVDLRSGAPAFGTPEYAKASMAAGQLARRFRLPYRSSNANASTSVDAQAAYESMMSLWGALMGGANMLHHGAGWLEGGLVASFEKVVLDAELLQNMTEFMKPIAVDQDSLAFEAMQDVGPGGHFFGTAHTLERYETAFYAPILSDWRNFESWQEAGSKTATERANAVWKRLLAEYEPPPLDQGRREALAAYVARRKEEYGRLAA
ncbi:trimethylamine---corrinoid protein Co-methyltransferase [Tistlia consotensis]|uniref:Methyltransferase n=1 Tax=Tistlia consotensis USBA 355 TaxID=560819 RepID=A0A1Y6B9C9_9PROT|nr:trimethylamine methyltransferase family protein [Tistlia consotensis]SME88529.1 trimethylamine---corrinoid protein Co-methyltransferase [Tistlia consotensis USBA 355]SNR25003.1 trimethylamine---corrinoid protein Co-methyltransferase [Tistlia consotensis]